MSEQASAAADVYAGISRAMKEFAREGVAKLGENKQQGAGFKFRSIDQILNAASAAFRAAEIVVIPSVLSHTSTERENRNGTLLTFVTLEVEYRIISIRDGSMMLAQFIGQAMDSGDKAYGKAFSMAYKTAIIQIFAVPLVGEDEDPDSQTHETVRSGASYQEPLPQPRQAPPAKPQTQAKKKEYTRDELQNLLDQRIAHAEGLGIDTESLKQGKELANMTEAEIKKLGTAIANAIKVAESI